MISVGKLQLGSLIGRLRPGYIPFMFKDYLKGCATHWSAHIAKLRALPRHIWTDIDDIVSIINGAANCEAALQILHPRGGESDVIGAAISREPHCIAIETGGAIIVLRPAQLRLELFPDEHAYLWLSTSPLVPTGVYATNHAISEELTDLGSHYVSRSVWDQGFLDDYDDQQLPEDARVVVRNLSGHYLFMSKGTPFFQGWRGAQGAQHGLSADEFREVYRRRQSL